MLCTSEPLLCLTKATPDRCVGVQSPYDDSPCKAVTMLFSAIALPHYDLHFRCVAIPSRGMTPHPAFGHLPLKGKAGHLIRPSATFPSRGRLDTSSVKRLARDAACHHPLKGKALRGRPLSGASASSPRRGESQERGEGLTRGEPRARGRLDAGRAKSAGRTKNRWIRGSGSRWIRGSGSRWIRRSGIRWGWPRLRNGGKRYPGACRSGWY